jgi:hypothetical protein
MHSKAIKICILKFLGCQLAQRVHGSKVEAKESTENSKAAQERQGGVFIGLAREASRQKRFLEKVVPSDEPMVPPAERRIIRSLTDSNIVVKPRNPDNVREVTKETLTMRKLLSVQCKSTTLKV